jgi:hypothetical protein
MMDKSAAESEGKIEPVATGSMEEGISKKMFTEDEYQLAQLGYKQEFFRGLGLFENWLVNHCFISATRSRAAERTNPTKFLERPFELRD